ncbi:MAG: mannose-1-phosphate guanylyltransferase, partial [Anaerolinea sp.]|nr:mannose-1-phosphate guanylyltransferase [Anaerolinea sp.]
MKRFAVIMAGGGGTRLWPLSTREHPKHLLKLHGDETMYAMSVRRLYPAFPLDQIYVVTVKEQVDKLRLLTPELPAENFIIEPEPKGTASVVGLAAITLQKRDPDSVMIVLTSDHLIGNNPEFLHVLDTGCAAADQGGLYTIGITPTYAAIGYGYIEIGKQVTGGMNMPIHHVVKFKEKPAQKQAEEFLRSGTHLWNSGIFIWKTRQILDEFRHHMPDFYTQLEKIKQSWQTKIGGNLLPQIWATIQPETIDYGIMEKARDIYVIPAKNLEWNDVGSWLSLFEFLDADEHGNIRLG